MRRIRKPLIWIFSILLVLFVIFFIAASIYIKNFEDDLETILTNNIGLKTRIDGNISLKIMPGISFIAKDIKVISNETYVLKIDEAEISIDYFGIFKSNIDVKALRLVNPQVYIVRGLDGNFNYDSDRINAGSPDEDSAIHDFNLSELQVTNGRLLYIDLQYNDTLMMDMVNLNSDQVGIKGSLSNIEVEKIMFNGTVEIGLIKVNRLVAETMDFKIDGRGGKMAILPLNTTYFGGDVGGKTILDFTKKPAQLHMQHQINGFDLGRFGVAMQNNNIFEGKIDYKLDITFSSFNWSKAKQSLNGTVMITGKDMLFRGFEMENALKGFENNQQFDVLPLTSLFVAGPFGSVFTKGINFSDQLSQNKSDSTQINTLVSNWIIKSGEAKAKDVAYNTNNYRLALTGELNFRNSSYNNISIALVNADGCDAISENINGLFERPETTSKTIFGSLSGSPENFWNTLNNPRRQCIPFYAGTISHPN